MNDELVLGLVTENPLKPKSFYTRKLRMTKANALATFDQLEADGKIQTHDWKEAKAKGAINVQKGGVYISANYGVN